jgi:hypothetical protein
MPEESREDTDSPVTRREEPPGNETSALAAEAIASVADFSGGDPVRVKRLSQLVLEFADQARSDPNGAADPPEALPLAPPPRRGRMIAPLAIGLFICLVVAGFMLVDGKPELGAGREASTEVVGKPLPTPEQGPASALMTALPEAEAAAEPNTVASPGPASTPAMPIVEPQASAAELAVLVARGDAFMQSHDIATARLFYERAAEAGDGHAALRMGATFDPAFLERAGIRGAKGDQREALSWYRRAHDLGDMEADRLLGKIETR